VETGVGVRVDVGPVGVTVGVRVGVGPVGTTVAVRVAVGVGVRVTVAVAPAGGFFSAGTQSSYGFRASRFPGPN
jgi:hypothetical protein